MSDTVDQIYTKLDAQLIGELLCLQEEIGDMLTFIDERTQTPNNTDRLAYYDLELSNYMAEILRMKELVSSTRSEIAKCNNIEG